MANQFVYSSSPHNLDGNSGWGILTKTSGLQLDGDQLRQMQDFVVEPYSGNDAADVDKPRQSFSFFKANGCWLLECSTATGKRWYLGDNRGGEYVAHVYVFNALEDDFSPFVYLNSDGFWKEIPADWKEKAKEISMMDTSSAEKRYPPVPPLPASLEANSLYKFANILGRVREVAVPEIGKILETVASRLSNPNSVPCPIFDADSAAAIDTMALVSQLFPRGDRRRLQFSTFLNKDYADRIPTFNELAFYGTVKDGISDSNTGLFDGTTFVSCRYPLVLKSKEDIKAFKEIVDDLEADGSFEDAVRRFVVIRTNIEDLPNLLKSHLDDAEKLVAEIDAHFSNKTKLYDVFKDVKAIPANIKKEPEWFKAVRAAQTAQGIVFEPGCIDIGKTAEYQEANETLSQFDADAAEPLNSWLLIAGLLSEPSNLENVVRKLKCHHDYSRVIRELILDTMQRATADLQFDDFFDFVHQSLMRNDNDIIQGVLLNGLMSRYKKLQAEVDIVKVRFRLTKVGLFLLLLALLGYWAGRLSAMF